MGWGYGALFSSEVLQTESYVDGTELAMSDAQWQLFASLLLDGQQLATRGPNFDFAASGRLMTYNAMNDSWGLNGGRGWLGKRAHVCRPFPLLPSTRPLPLLCGAVRHAPGLPSLPAAHHNPAGCDFCAAAAASQR